MAVIAARAVVTVVLDAEPGETMGIARLVSQADLDATVLRKAISAGAIEASVHAELAPSLDLI